MVALQEMPESTEVGQLPRSVDVLVTNDLVDLAKQGDRIQIVGVYKPLTGRPAFTFHEGVRVSDEGSHVS